LHGEIIGSARVSIGKHVLTQSGVFALDAGPILYNQIAVQVPEGARFVASKRGSKYYAVDSAGGSNLAPANRIYFSSKEEAESAGYRSQ